MPVLKVSGTNAIITFLMMVALFGALHLFAAANPDWRWSKGWVALGF